MKKLLLGVALSVLVSSVANAGTIGVSIAFTNTYLTKMRKAMEQEAKAQNQPLTVEIANSDVNTQISQIQNFVAAKVDAIIVYAIDTSTTASMTKLAQDAGIPIVYVNSQPIDIDQLGPKGAFVGSNESESGTLETKEVCRLLKEGGKSTVAIIQGDLRNQAAIQRTKDIHDVIATDECSFMKVIQQQAPGWDPVKAQDLMTNWIAAGIKPDAVIANNDDQAVGAIRAMAAAGWDPKEVVVAGIDATAEALSYMKQGDLDVTIYQDAAGQGRSAVTTAMKLAKGEKVDSKVWIPFQLVTPANMNDFVQK
ncbi:sugar ABC transporter substrate-binding protein [Mesorhizobium sp. M3A.F.Ca.ET.080.04.2.1]|uniref:substrate-binding domain-containing protein n=1 Tax=Mesorhizobium sp. M3A.F.Ca.ET.080.04.2.1 TaxID=2493676 RepID=UPI000F74F2BC|nr:substrate-binding domain-containing protein [Mesorhizobium sp. M3A.F.Ca.ET.080.04.2.1]AZO07956.1 sugar ABC transporter substrate-binding protein [Mesorhizobium sp. M3A.F.Ca.ET.080.04.2.1]RWF17823.1 MAG: sugar ABC transporter substrate-binding protein [Mesorhizobium sp.]